MGSFASQGYEHLRLTKNLTISFAGFWKQKKSSLPQKPTVVTENNYVMGMYAWDSILVAF